MYKLMIIRTHQTINHVLITKWSSPGGSFVTILKIVNGFVCVLACLFLKTILTGFFVVSKSSTALTLNVLKCMGNSVGHMNKKPISVYQIWRVCKRCFVLLKSFTSLTLIPVNCERDSISRMIEALINYFQFWSVCMRNSNRILYLFHCVFDWSPH